MSDLPAFWSNDDANPGVDRRLLNEVAELRRELGKLGSHNESGYRLAPALGGTVIRQRTGTPGTRSPFSEVLARVN